MDLRWRATKMAAFATIAPTTVPIAAHTASPNRAKAQKPNIEADGKPTKTGAVASTERANGQIRRGRVREATAAPMQATKAMSAANGKTKITEKSMRDYQVECRLSTQSGHDASYSPTPFPAVASIAIGPTSEATMPGPV